MAYTTIVTGTTITSSWANSDVRDQVVVPFSSTSARSSAITSPVTGMVSTLTANNSTEGIYQYNSASQWRPPWNLPFGRVGFSALPGSFTFNSSVGYSSTFTFTAIQNRYYKVCCGGEFQNGTVTGVVDSVSMYTSAAVAVRNPGARFTPVNTSSQEYREFSFEYNHSTTGGTVTWKIGCISTASATNQTFVPYTLDIVDIGPSGAPT